MTATLTTAAEAVSAIRSGDTVMVGGFGLVSNRASDVVANGSAQLVEGEVPAVSTMVDAKSASVLDARLRARASTLVVWGEWPRVEARLSAERVVWDGAGHGRGRLDRRELRVAVTRGGQRSARDLVLP
jgi:hypothetical protein